MKFKNIGKVLMTVGCFLMFSADSAGQGKEKSTEKNQSKNVPAAEAARVNRLCHSVQNAPPNAKEIRSRRAISSNKRKMEEILTAARARTSALIARDAGLLRKILAPDFVYTNASGKVFDRESYIENYALESSVSWTSQTLSDVCVVFSGETAVLTAVTHDVARFGDYRLDARFRTTQVYRRAAGGWIYLAGHTSNIDASSD